MDELRKNSTHVVDIEGFTSGGAGVARIGGRVVFVKNALLGERCEIKIVNVKKKTAHAIVTKFLRVSGDRTEPSCPVFGKCGGCNFMHMNYGAELELKKQRVEDALRRIGKLDVKVSGIIGAESAERYRNKAIYAVGHDGQKPVTGFYRERSHTIVPVEECEIQAEVSERAAAAVRRWMDEFSAPAYDERDDTGLIRHVFCRYAFATGQAQVVVVSRRRDIPQPDALISILLEKCPEIKSIVLNVNKARGNTVLSGDFHTLWGSEYIEDELFDLKFKLSPMSFYQINRRQAEKLYAEILRYADLKGGETVLDLYCGTGTITLCAARHAGRAIGAEIVEAAIADARENARINKIENAEFVCADVFEVAKMFEETGGRVDVVIVDPPRKGIAENVIEKICDLAPEKIIYVSCDPATLARDLSIFCGYEYEVEEVKAVDMFPRCAHVECVVLMCASSKAGKC